MTCEETRAEIRPFLEDLLREESRARIRRHFEECIDCRHYALSMGTFASDLKKLGDVKVPFDLQIPVRVEFDRKSKRSRFFFVKVVVSCLFFYLAVSGIYHGVLKIFETGKSFKSSVNTASKEKNEIPPELLQLQTIAQHLRVSANSSKKTAPVVSSGKNRQISLRPLHWHIGFNNLEGRDALIQKIHSLNLREDFSSPFFLVLSSDRNGLEQLLFSVQQYRTISGSASGKNKIPENISQLPEFQGNVRISLAFRLLSGKTDLKEFHAHCEFMFSNQIAFKEGLKNQGLQFLYEAPEILVMDLNDAQWLEFKETYQSFQGIKIDWAEDPELWGNSNRQYFRVSLYLTEV